MVEATIVCNICVDVRVDVKNSTNKVLVNLNSMDSRRTNSLDLKKPRGDTTEGGSTALQRRGGSSRASDVFEGRATLMEEKWSWSLMVRQVGFSDEGEYRCRLDFQSSPTHNARVRLHVVGKYKYAQG